MTRIFHWICTQSGLMKNGKKWWSIPTICGWIQHQLDSPTLDIVYSHTVLEWLTKFRISFPILPHIFQYILRLFYYMSMQKYCKFVHPCSWQHWQDFFVKMLIPFYRLKILGISKQIFCETSVFNKSFLLWAVTITITLNFWPIQHYFT